MCLVAARAAPDGFQETPATGLTTTPTVRLASLAASSPALFSPKCCRQSASISSASSTVSARVAVCPLLGSSACLSLPSTAPARLSVASGQSRCQSDRAPLPVFAGGLPVPLSLPLPLPL
eukprot:6167469-Pyramimonas_sp.AAC.1